MLGLLGPNGAGKTTAVRLLTTLLTPDSGHAEVAGHDVVKEPHRVRSLVGLAGQFAAVDDNLSGRENLRMVGRLYHLASSDARARAGELLERFDLVEAADRLVRTYSGGMRRRLDVAASLVARPEVLFLDEPTTGLDPRSRIGLWQEIAGLVEEGATVLLTTQYLEEADRLATSIAVIDRGRIIAEGTADELKAQVGGEVLEITLKNTEDGPAAVASLARPAGTEPSEAEGVVRITTERGAAMLAEVVRVLDRKKIAIGDMSVRRPTLDDVFLALTGHGTKESSDEAGAPRSHRRGRPRP